MSGYQPTEQEMAVWRAERQLVFADFSKAEPVTIRITDTSWPAGATSSNASTNREEP